MKIDRTHKEQVQNPQPASSLVNQEIEKDAQQGADHHPRGRQQAMINQETEKIVQPLEQFQEQSAPPPLFQPAYDPRKNRDTPPAELSEGYWFIFYQNNLLLQVGCSAVPEILVQTGSGQEQQDGAPIHPLNRDSNSAPKAAPPSTTGTARDSAIAPLAGAPLAASDLLWALPRIQRIYYFGTLKGKPCWACSLTSSPHNPLPPTAPHPPASSQSASTASFSPAGSQSSPSLGSSTPGSSIASPSSPASIPSSPSVEAGFPPRGWDAVNLRMAYGRLPPDELQAARFASHLLFWDRNTRFCGVCGSSTKDKSDERAKLCTNPACGAVFYPKISPAVIVAILDRDRILLAHNRRFVSRFYSLIAGFVEIGENLEDCVRREVLEEVGVRVKNIRYFGSQPWPTPDSLMIGFIADYAGGEIRIQDDELHDARWFSPPDMPQLPPSDSIARKILRWYEEEYVPKIREGSRAP